MCPMSALELLILIIKFITNKLMYFTFIEYLDFMLGTDRDVATATTFLPISFFTFLLYFHEEGSIKKTS